MSSGASYQGPRSFLETSSRAQGIPVFLFTSDPFAQPTMLLKGAFLARCSLML